MPQPSSEQLIAIDPSDAGKRLDAFLAERIEGWSRSRLQRLIENGDVLVNEKETKASYKLRPGDEIDIDLTEEPAARFEPENIPLDIVFEDEYLAVINKPAGMVVHPGAGVPSGTLANAIAWHFKSEPPALAGGFFPPRGDKNPPANAGGSDRVGIVHRLDKDTSGLIVVAKDEQTHEALAEQFRRRQVFKSYVALVHGSPRDNSGTIDRPIARDRWHRTKMTVAANGRQALSLWKVRQRFEKFTLLEVEIKTGRTHQIRVHLASINHPVVGDATYNEGRDNTIANVEIKKAVEKLGRFFLHAKKLSFAHPKTGERLSFTSELPEELAQLLKLL
jgi:23S rRNA pseudouridine1911/1915/1917 synthase